VCACVRVVYVKLLFLNCFPFSYGNC